MTAATGCCSEVVIFLTAISSIGAILHDQLDMALALNTLGIGFLAVSAVRVYGWTLLGQRFGPWLGAGSRMHRFNAGAGGMLLLIAALMAWNSIVSPSFAALQ